jgi:hypothetical protein
MIHSDQGIHTLEWMVEVLTRSWVSLDGRGFNSILDVQFRVSKSLRVSDKPVWGHIPRYVPLYLIRHWRISVSLVSFLLHLIDFLAGSRVVSGARELRHLVASQVHHM